MNAQRDIIIIGGGFAGTQLARRLLPRLPADARLTLVSEESYTTFNPLLPEAVGAALFPEQIVAPIREIVRPGGKGRFIMGKALSVDLGAREIVCHTLAGETVLRFDQLVLAFGNRARLDLIPGAEAHALPLKTVGDAVHLRNAVLRRLARIELERQSAVRRRLGAFAVIGGGFSGVEVAGELVDCLAGIRRFYPQVAADEISVTLLQDLDRLLPELPAALGRAAHRSLAQRGTAVRLGVRVVGIDAAGIRLDNGERVAASTVICTIGTRPNGLVEAMRLATVRGRIAVDADLRVSGADRLWAVGDCAAIPNAADGSIAPPTAQFAVREARLLADNLLAALAGAPTAKFRYRSRGMMAAIGHRRGVAQIFGLRLSGLPAWLIWRAYYLLQMPTFGRKLRISVEWSWGMLFPADITHLRFRRSVDVEPVREPIAPRPSVREAVRQ